MVLPLARRQYRAQQLLVRQATRTGQRAWREVDPADLTQSWLGLLPRLLAAVRTNQERAAALSAAYIAAATGTQGGTSASAGTVIPAAFAGIASDGRALDSLLFAPVTHTKVRIARGQPLRQALATGLLSLLRLISTQIQDAGRVAAGVAIVADPAITGYVRHVTLPSCARCLILAGRHYPWSDGFARHPRCDCVHIPTVANGRDLTTDPVEVFRGLPKQEQDRIFGPAAAQAIRDGADIFQVVNAERGMSTASVHGRRLRITSEGTTRRGLAGRRMARDARLRGTGLGVRLMPEEIYAAARNRAEALRLLRRYGYLL